MASNNLKSYLKDAREAIKNKDYQNSLKICKSIMKQDKENYMGLVFLGISLQEVGPCEQAEKAFQKAVEINPNNILAWNGLQNYYEKLKSDNAKCDLVKVYLKILDLETNDKKLIEICEKLEYSKDIPNDQFTSIVQGIHKTAKKLKEQNCFSIGPWSGLVTIISEKRDKTQLSEEHQQILEDALSELVHNTQWMTIDYFSQYLRILYQRKKYGLLVEEAKKMHSIYEQSTVPLEWICKLYNELEIEGNKLAIEIEPVVQEFYKNLQRISPKSSIALFTKAVFQFKSNEIAEAKDSLKEVLLMRSGLLHAWILLACCYLQLKFYGEALKSLEKAEKLLASINNSNTNLYLKVSDMLIETLSRDTLQENWEKCIERCEKIGEGSRNKNVILSLVRSYINLGKATEAKAELTKLEDKEEDLSVVLLRAKLLQKEGKLEDALQLLINFKNSNYSELWLEIGLLHWKMEAFDKSAVPFLKAAKLDPNSYLSFLYLGHYYQKSNNLEKARKCYEKSFKINSNCIEAALELSKIYRKLECWDSNLTLLQELTGSSVKDCNYWAWVQLGVSYLEQHDFERAIDTWRYLVRCELSNSHFWEGLADSYLARGSYTSALKSYQKAAEITPNALYPLLQIANVKRVLGQYAEARSDFESILATNEKYVPALKGLAETCLNQAKLYNMNQLLGLARDCAQAALDNLILAIQERSDFSCLWKLAADSCCIVASLPEKYCCLLVPASLIEGKDVEGNKILERDELYVLATRYYCRSLSLAKDNILVWHDLASCYLSHASSTTNPGKAKQLYDKALTAAKHCTKENPTNWQHWNLLGNIALLKDPSNYALAQHAFIKAVTADHNSAVAWSNLGSLYLKLDEFKLANVAFAKAQRADPTYVNSWVGQALIAETMGAEEAMDLFRHSTQLGLQMQGALGYGHWVCQTLIDSPPHTFIYSIHKMHAISVACDALTWYIERNPYESCAWNMLGLLRERLGLKVSSLEAFQNAYKRCIEVHRDKAKINSGRLLFRLGRYSEAIDFYRDVKEANFKSGSGLALALFKDKQYEESYEAYESALHWLTDEQLHQSDLLVALASMAYMFQGPDAAKLLLFQSVKCEPPSPFGYYSTLALSLLHEDFKVAEAVVKEIKTLKDKTECIPHISVLLSHFYSLNDEPTKAVRELSKLVHRHPEEAPLWLSLAILFTRLGREKSDITLAASRCAQVAVKLRQTNMDIKKALCVISLLCSLAGDQKEAMKAAQKAVHSYPDVPECWCVLMFTLSFNKKKCKSQKPWLWKALHYTQSIINDSSPLRDWLKKQELFFKKI